MRAQNAVYGYPKHLVGQNWPTRDFPCNHQSSLSQLITKDGWTWTHKNGRNQSRYEPPPESNRVGTRCFRPQAIQIEAPRFPGHLSWPHRLGRWLIHTIFLLFLLDSLFDFVLEWCSWWFWLTMRVESGQWLAMRHGTAAILQTLWCPSSSSLWACPLLFLSRFAFHFFLCYFLLLVRPVSSTIFVRNTSA